MDHHYIPAIRKGININIGIGINCAKNCVSLNLITGLYMSLHALTWKIVNSLRCIFKGHS